MIHNYPYKSRGIVSGKNGYTSVASMLIVILSEPILLARSPAMKLLALLDSIHFEDAPTVRNLLSCTEETTFSNVTQRLQYIFHKVVHVASILPLFRKMENMLIFAKR